MNVFQRAIMHVMNNMSNFYRNKDYNKKVRKGNRLRILCEGDSWMHFPFSSQDLYSYLSKNESLALYSIAGGGKKLKNVYKNKLLINSIEKTSPSILVLSIGGNDLIADFDTNLFLQKKDNNYNINPSGERFFDELGIKYDSIFSIVQFKFPELKVICHGYSYPLPEKNTPLKTTFTSKQKIPLSERWAIQKLLVDRLNSEILSRSKKFAKVEYLDIRKMNKSLKWKDEVHLKNFEHIGKLIEQQIKLCS